MNKIEINTELQLVPHLNGVKIAAPSKRQFEQNNVTVAGALAFPCNVYLMNTESLILNINDYSALSSGFYSTEDAIGKTVFDVLKSDNAQFIISKDKQVIREKCSIISEDIMVRKDDTIMNFLTIKAPIYNEASNIIGLLGCSVLLGSQPLVESLAYISKLGLITFQHKQIIATAANEIVWTPREREVIHLLTRGKTAKEIGLALNLSKRTIEHYIENIKIKMNVKTKSQLIDKALSSQFSFSLLGLQNIDVYC